MWQEVYVQLKKPDGSVVHCFTTPIKRPDVGAVLTRIIHDCLYKPGHGGAPGKK